MRCRVGDLAYVTSQAETPGLAGRFVIVEKLVLSGDFEIYGEWWVDIDKPSWVCRPASGGLLPHQRLDGAIGFIPKRLIPDSILIPIRDPGDDATDEMVERVGKPQEVTA